MHHNEERSQIGNLISLNFKVYCIDSYIYALQIFRKYLNDVVNNDFEPNFTCTKRCSP